MALGHCRHRIHSLGWSILMFLLIYWACIDEPWVSLVTRVQSAIKNESNLLKNVSFAQARLHIWAGTVAASINNEYTSNSSRWVKQKLLSSTYKESHNQTILSFFYLGRSESPKIAKQARERETNQTFLFNLTDGSTALEQIVGNTCPSVATRNVLKTWTASSRKHKGNADLRAVG